jgi:GrpB-like predicted nucleotidyltransferase (UPF0157 family)
MRLDRIAIVEYDARWPRLFEEQRDPELAAADDEDRPAYRAGKAPFITRVLQQLED